MFVAFHVIYFETELHALFATKLGMLKLTFDAHNLCATSGAILFWLEKAVPVEELLILQWDGLSCLVTQKLDR